MFNKKYFLKTQLKKEEAIEQLKLNIATGNYLKRHFTGDQIYEGEIVKDYFEIKLITPGRNPFKIIIRGKFLDAPDATVIKMKLEMQVAGIVFMVIIELFFALSLLFLLKDLINNKSIGDEGMAVVIFTVLNIFLGGLYFLHVDYAKTNLRELWDAEEVKL
jgi:hypothetical protein